MAVGTHFFLSKHNFTWPCSVPGLWWRDAQSPCPPRSASPGVPSHAPVTGPCSMPAPGLALYVYHFMKSPTSAYEIRVSLTSLLEAKTLRLEEMSSKVAPSVFDLHGAIPLL